MPLPRVSKAISLDDARRRPKPAIACVLLALASPSLPSMPSSSAATPFGDGAPGDARASIPDVWIERETYAMGTRLRVRVGAADRETAIGASEAAFEAVRETDELLSTWRPGTGLAALNASPANRSVSVTSRLVELLGEVGAWVEDTGGAFDPAVGALLDAWDLRGDGRTPTAARLERALGSTGLRCFQLDVPAGRVKRSCTDAWLDAGAFGKGAALRRARHALESAGARSALLDFGGQQLAFGLPPHGSAWTVHVAHPARRDEAVVGIRITGGSVATTGQSERAIQTPEGRFGHVIDPRSGHPAPAWGSVTVVTDDPLAADVLSTALFVMGPSAGTEWLRRRPEIAALFVVDGPRGLSFRATGAMRSLLVVRPTPDEALRSVHPPWATGSVEGSTSEEESRPHENPDKTNRK